MKLICSTIMQNQKQVLKGGRRQYLSLNIIEMYVLMIILKGTIHVTTKHSNGHNILHITLKKADSSQAKVSFQICSKEFINLNTSVQLLKSLNHSMNLCKANSKERSMSLTHSKVFLMLLIWQVFIKILTVGIKPLLLSLLTWKVPISWTTVGTE